MQESTTGKGGSRSDRSERQDAYASCLQIARGHYENFPVISVLLPRAIRQHIAAIYVFARTADDYADEGEAPITERLAALDRHESRLDRALDGYPDSPPFVALGATLRETGIDDRHLRDLLDAFRQDVRNNGFADQKELLDYCKRSACPVGQLVLALYHQTDPEALAASDDICTGLQLVNFWQDIGRDLPTGRINLPRATMQKHRYDRAMLEAGIENEDFRAMVRDLTEEAADYLRRGARLLPMVRSWRLRSQLRWTIIGGLAIAEKIGKNDACVLSMRPTLGKSDIGLLLRLRLRSNTG